MHAVDAETYARAGVPSWAVDDQFVESIDPFTYEVVRHRLLQVNEEQAAALKKATGSVVVNAGDFNVALASADGEVVYDGNYALFHAAATGTLFERLLDWAPEAVGIYDGDMFFTNDPFIGALHQNDGALVTPIFWEGKLVCWSAAVLHAMDVGGTEAGSFCVNARDRWDDPVRIPPIKVAERGRIRRDIEAMYFGMSRMPHLAALDLRAQISAGNVARSRIHALIETYGVDVICAVMQRVLDESEKALRARLRELPDGTWRATQYVDKAGIGDKGIHKIALALTKEDDGLTFDLRGSDPQAGIIGCPLNVSKAALVVPVLVYLCAGLPRSSSAVLRVCDFITEPGTLPDVTLDASVSCSSATGTYTQIAVARQAVGRMLATHPKYRYYVTAPSYTNPWVLMLSGTDQGGDPFVTMLMDPTLGATGARPDADGVDNAGVDYVVHGRAPDVEINELYYPILYLYRREAMDSAGAGRYRGGAGMEMAFAYRGEGLLNMMTLGFGAAFPDNVGMAGGFPSATIEYGVQRAAGVEAAFAAGELPSDFADHGTYAPSDFKGNDAMGRDDVFLGRDSASAGWGDPLERDPEVVARDVREGLVSRAAAHHVYGVSLDANGAPDAGATEERRAAIREERRTHPLAEESLTTVDAEA